MMHEEYSWDTPFCKAKKPTTNIILNSMFAMNRIIQGIKENGELQVFSANCKGFNR